jgi:hypothetical protein
MEGKWTRESETGSEREWGSGGGREGGRDRIVSECKGETERQRDRETENVGGGVEVP